MNQPRDASGGSSHPPPSQGALALRENQIEPWRDPEWQRLWLAVAGQRWHSLSLVPAAQGAPLDFTLIVAAILARTGMVHLGTPIQVADGTQVPLARLTPFLEQVRQCTENGDRVLVALPPAAKSPVTASIAQASDASLLCVLLDNMMSAEAKKTVSQIGAGRFLGSAMFHPHSLKMPK